MSVSIIICTYNGRDRLRLVLDAVADLDDLRSSEVIVVDNASTDGTEGLAAELLSQGEIDGRVVREPAAGLTNARRTGIASSTGEIMVFVDDDNLLASDYLSRAQRLMDENPRWAVVGGLATGETTVRFPTWWEDFAPHYAVGPQAASAGTLPSGSWVYGAGLVLRRAAWEQLSGDGFEFSLGDRTGGTLLSGGDVELCLALQQADWAIGYSPALQLRHRMDPARLNTRYLWRLAWGGGQTSVHLDPYWLALRGAHGRHWSLSAALAVIKGLGRVAAALARLDRLKATYEFRWSAGRISELFRIRGAYLRAQRLVRSAPWSRRDG